MYKLGLGLMRHQENNQNNTNSIVDFAMEHGINYIETCNFYLHGKCEHIAYEAIKKYDRSTYTLCAKFPVKSLENSNTNIDKLFKEQLETLHTDYFDVYLLQAIDVTTIKLLYKSKIIQYFLEKKKQGVIKKLGFSFHDSPEILKLMLDLKCWDCVQLQLNYYDWFLSSGEELYKVCEEYNIPIIVMGPTKGGTLINNLPEGARKLFSNYKKAPLDFLKRYPLIKIVLTGANTLNQITENVEYAKDSEAEYKLDDFKKAIDIYKSFNYIQCTECNYCNRCPRNVPISYYFKEYNNILKYGTEYSNYTDYMHFLRENMPMDKCINCGLCERMCPQHLPIRKLFNSNIFQMRL